ncbi:MAG TPA: hypothetical protein VFW17_22100 [Ktedonobacterales bacterium]|nr:hypothetical protein [Ktedonobacterales bacterium]
MSTSVGASSAEPAETTDTITNCDLLAQETQATAARLYDAVAAAYLDFRRTYYHEEQPSLATTPPAHDEIHRADIALLAESTLRLVPTSVRTLPVVGGLVDHLRQVSDLNSISESERTALHNMTMAFLYGMKNGIQPWYVDWALASAKHLARVQGGEYFATFPWDACLYMTEDNLARFQQAIHANERSDIERAMQLIADHLITALRNPVEAQFEFAFTGPDAERRRTAFRLKTAAVMALGAYLVTEEVRSLLHPQERHVVSASVLAPLPPELSAHRVPGGDNVDHAAAHTASAG